MLARPASGGDVLACNTRKKEGQASSRRYFRQGTLAAAAQLYTAPSFLIFLLLRWLWVSGTCVVFAFKATFDSRIYFYQKLVVDCQKKNVSPIKLECTRTFRIFNN
jgi:hypothetical protein